MGYSSINDSAHAAPCRINQRLTSTLEADRIL